jgi:hypothetical protein
MATSFGCTDPYDEKGRSDDQCASPRDLAWQPQFGG